MKDIAATHRQFSIAITLIKRLNPSCLLKNGKWVRLGALEARKFPKKPQYFRHCFNICYMFYQMGSFGNLLFWALDFIYLTLIRAGLNQANSTGTGLIAIT
jgi:hypothetical protein